MSELNMLLEGGDNEAGDDKDAGAKKGDDDEVSDRDDFWAQCGLNTVLFIKGVFNGIMSLIMGCCHCLGMCWYPFKERSHDFCECCGKRMN